MKVSCVLPWTFPGRSLISRISLDPEFVTLHYVRSLLLNVLLGLGAVSQDDTMAFLRV